MVHMTEGEVFLQGERIRVRNADFPTIKTGETLETRDGLAEVLLTPGVFLRMPESTSIRMVSNKLADTRVQVLTGSVLVEVDELLDDNAITLLFGNTEVALAKHGLYRIDADPGVLKVYDGKAKVGNANGTLEAGRGKQVLLKNEILVAEKFNRKTQDAFNKWSARRASYIAAANTNAARTSGGRSSYSRWAWSPIYGMFTFLPGRGYGYSPYGYSLYSPQTIWVIYAPPRVSYGFDGIGTPSAGGYAGSPRNVYSGNSGPAYSAPAAAPAGGGGASTVRSMPRSGGGAGGQGR
jgi:hypothetical protein